MNRAAKKVLAASVAVSALLAISYFVLDGGSSSKSDIRFETVRVDRGTIEAKVTATGALSALVTVQVGSQVSGRVQELYADFNSEVKKGQVIAKIDPQLFKASLDQARANAAAANANLRKAKVQALDAERQYERTKSLAERNLIARAELDTALANKEAAAAQVDASGGAVAQAQAALSQTEVNLAYTTILSPINGIVISRNVDVGQTVAASLQAPILFVIAEDLRKMQVNTSVAEADIGKLESGMGASFVVDAFPGKVFEGTVRQIRNAATNVQNVITYDAVIDVANENLELRPGMTANVTFVHASADDVLRVPNSALRFKPSAELLARARDANDGSVGSVGSPSKAFAAGRERGGARRAAPDVQVKGAARTIAPRADVRTVWVLRGTTPSPLSIRTGISDGSMTELVEVLEGSLEEGDRLITSAAGGTGSDAPQRPGGGGRGGFRVFQ